MIKVLSGMLLFVLAGVHVYAQQDAKVIAEIAAGNEKMVKNAPFSAEAVSESVQTLADGNRIVRSGTTKLYRNSEGRFRREFSGNSGSAFGGTYFTYGSGISILDPVVGQRLMLEPTLRTARVSKLNGGQGVSITGSATVVNKAALSPAQRAEVERKVAEAKYMTEEQKVEYAAKTKEYAATATRLHVATATANAPGVAHTIASTYDGNSFVFPTNYIHEKYDTRTEDLGSRDFEGVMAEGTKKTTTIPAGAIGNERPIEITYERWYSKELEMVVYSKQSDPRVGDQTYKLTNLIRSEPDPSLFAVPEGYKILTEPASVYRLTTRPAVTVTGVGRAPGVPAAPKAPAVVTVKNTKP